MKTRKEANKPTSAPRRFKTYSCHKCEWNGRTDEAAERACLECSRRHVESDRSGKPFVDMPTDGRSWVHTDAAAAGSELAYAKADRLALLAMRGNSGAATALPTEAEEAALRFLRDIQEMSEPTARAFFWLLKGYDITRTAAQIGVTKQAVSKNLAYFFQTHPNWRALMPTHVDPTAWRRKLHGTW